MSALLEQLVVSAWRASLTKPQPFVVTVSFRRPDGMVETRRAVVAAPARQAPAGEDHMPPDAEFLRADVLPASRFADMALVIRERYRAEYSAFLRWQKAKALDMPADQLQPWKDYDPIHLEETVERWLRPYGRFAGD